MAQAAGEGPADLVDAADDRGDEGDDSRASPPFENFAR